MTRSYITPCTFCDGPIKWGKAMPGPHTDWHHEDLSICRERIRADERARVHDDLRRKIKAIQAPAFVNKSDVSAFREALYVVLALFAQEEDS